MPYSGRSYGLTVLGAVGEFLSGKGIIDWDDFEQVDPYDANTEWPTFIGPDMPVSPDAVCVLTLGVESRIRADVTTTIQIRLRGAADDPYSVVADKAQEIHDAFYPNGFPLASTALGSIRVGVVIPGDGLPLDPDASRRWGHIQNIRIRSRRPRPE